MSPAGTRVKPRLRAAECRALADVDARYKRAKRTLEELAAEREKLVKRARAKVVLGEWVRAGGWAIKITMQSSGQRFSLADYLKAGHRLTRAMREFVSPGSESPRLTVEPDAPISQLARGKPPAAA